MACRRRRWPAAADDAAEAARPAGRGAGQAGRRTAEDSSRADAAGHGAVAAGRWRPAMRGSSGRAGPHRSARGGGRGGRRRRRRRGADACRRGAAADGRTGPGQLPRQPQIPAAALADDPRRRGDRAPRPGGARAGRLRRASSPPNPISPGRGSPRCSIRCRRSRPGVHPTAVVDAAARDRSDRPRSARWR